MGADPGELFYSASSASACFIKPIFRHSTNHNRINSIRRYCHLYLCGRRLYHFILLHLQEEASEPEKEESNDEETRTKCEKSQCPEKFTTSAISSTSTSAIYTSSGIFNSWPHGLYCTEIKTYFHRFSCREYQWTDQAQAG
jgi:hypothetical protein